MPRIPAVLSLLLLGAVPAAGQTARPAACTEPEHHQFDFWIGEWDVTLPNGKAAGTNRIEPILNGGSAGATAIQRIIWEPTAPGEVRQLWETSTDGGTTWTTAFDGRYRKRR